jgi:hypothetical protein
VLVGYFFGGEVIGSRTVVGTLLVLVSVVVITTTPKKGELKAVKEAELTGRQSKRKLSNIEK